MSYTVIIPARLSSTRLPGKPLLDIQGTPMVVRVAQRMLPLGVKTVVAADDQTILEACHVHGVQALLTRDDHASGSDRLAEAVSLLGLRDDEVVVNVQGDEPLMEPALVNEVAQLLLQRNDCVASTAAHLIAEREDFINPNVVKVVTDKNQRALLFSRAPIPHWRDASASSASDTVVAAPAHALRHIGLYAYRAGFLRQFPMLELPPLEQCEALEQLRILWHGYSMAVHITVHSPGPGVDTAADLERVRSICAQAVSA